MNIVEPGASTSTEIAQDEYVITVRDLLGVLLRRLWIIVLVALVPTGMVLGFDLTRKPTYEATILIFVGQKPGSGVPGSLGSDVQGLEQLTKTMATLVATRHVTSEVIDRLDLGLSSREVLENLSVEPVGETQVIKVSYEDASPKMATQIANSVGIVFSEQISEEIPSANAITATVWERAMIPSSPVSPKPFRDSLLAMALGIMIGIGLAFVLEDLDEPLGARRKRWSESPGSAP